MGTWTGGPGAGSDSHVNAKNFNVDRFRPSEFDETERTICRCDPCPSLWDGSMATEKGGWFLRHHV